MSTEWLYVAEIVDNLREIFKVAFVLSISSILVGSVFYFFAITDKKQPYLDEVKRIFYRLIWLTVVITLCFALLPSKNTIYAISGVPITSQTSEALSEKKEK